MSLPALMQRLTVPHLVVASVVLVSLVAFVSVRVKRGLVLNPSRVRRGEIYRLLTAGWIHADAMHLIMNMLVLYMFADRVVAKFGSAIFVAFYVSAVVVAYVPTAIRFRNRPQYNSLGASGAVAAVMFCAILLDPTLRLHLLFVPVALPGIVFGVLYMLYSVWHSHGSDDNINHDAHFSGAAYGVIVTYLLAAEQVERTVRVLLRWFGL